MIWKIFYQLRIKLSYFYNCIFLQLCKTLSTIYHLIPFVVKVKLQHRTVPCPHCSVVLDRTVDLNRPAWSRAWTPGWIEKKDDDPCWNIIKDWGNEEFHFMNEDFKLYKELNRSQAAGSNDKKCIRQRSRFLDPE